VEDSWNESSETSEQPEETEQRELEQATFEPGETVERQGDYEMSEAIESGFADLIDSSDVDTGNSMDIHPQAGGQESIDHLPVERVAKIDSFTWKLQVAKDEVGQFRIPSLHGEPVVDAPDPDTPNPTGQPIGPNIESSSEDGQAEPGLASLDISEAANIVMGAAVEDIQQDLEDLQAEQEAMNEAKQKIRDQLGSMNSVELDAEPASRPQAPNGLAEEIEQVAESGVEESDASNEPQVQYGEAASEPHDRADPDSIESSEDRHSPPARDPESAEDESRD
jgi:hypothetical protein